MKTITHAVFSPTLRNKAKEKGFSIAIAVGCAFEKTWVGYSELNNPLQPNVAIKNWLKANYKEYDFTYTAITEI